MTSSSSGALAALSSELAAAVAAAGPSVVALDAGRRDASGIVWDEHLIVGADHAVERDDEIAIALEGGTAGGRVVGRDPSTDLALIHTDATLHPGTHADASALRVGHLVLALARDDDGAAGASLGVISALDGPWRTWRGGDIDRFIRPDLNVYPGFSGGPLVDASGALVGLNTWGLSRRWAVTVPVATIARVVTQLRDGGRIKRGYLGIALQAVRLPDALRAARGLDQRGGAIVVDVAAGGPAERGGLMIGDVILGLGAHAVEDAEDLQHALGAGTVGSTQTLRVLRGGDVRELAVAVGERPHDE